MCIISILDPLCPPPPPPLIELTGYAVGKRLAKMPKGLGPTEVEVGPKYFFLLRTLSFGKVFHSELLIFFPHFPFFFFFFLFFLYFPYDDVSRETKRKCLSPRFCLLDFC